MSEHIEVILDDQGRLVLPSPLQRRLGLTPGMTLVVERETPGAAYLKVQDEKPRLVDKKGVLVVQVQPLDDIENVVRQERDRRATDLLPQSDQ